MHLRCWLIVEIKGRIQKSIITQDITKKNVQLKEEFLLYKSYLLHIILSNFDRKTWFYILITYTESMLNIDLLLVLLRPGPNFNPGSVLIVNSTSLT